MRPRKCRHRQYIERAGRLTRVRKLQHVMAKQSSDPPAPARGTAAFQSRNFRRYQIARLLAIVGAEAQAVAVAWQVYQITHRALDLGLTGLALFAPGLFFMLWAGHVADRYDRRWIIMAC